MKKRLSLVALAVPLAFAACSQDSKPVEKPSLPKVEVKVPPKPVEALLDAGTGDAGADTGADAGAAPAAVDAGSLDAGQAAPAVDAGSAKPKAKKK